MILGALLDLGAPARAVREAVASLGVERIAMRVSKVTRGPLAARHVSFRGPRRSAVERKFGAIRALLDRAPLAERVRERSLRVFTRLAEAEGRVHGIAPDEVHFHEVGAADALGDVVGVCAALEQLGVERISCSPLPLGRGSVESAHGLLPLPAPATLELLVGIPTYPYDVEWETVTPTGAALIAALASEFGPLPAVELVGQGFGAGGQRPGPLPNVLRALLGVSSASLSRDVVSVIETHLDDMNPEQLPYLMERLMSDGALDVSLSPLSMKKGRPGQLLRVLARPADRDRLARRILLESSTIGVRYHEVPRLKLEREVHSVETDYGRIRVKVVRDPDGSTTASAEFESCARAARRHGVPIEQVYRAAERRAEEQLRES
jgi:hypothetical protein